MTVYSPPGSDGAIVAYESRYDHWIGGEYVPPVKGQYFQNPSPVTGLGFSKYCPLAGGTYSPPIQWSYRARYSATAPG